MAFFTELKQITLKFICGFYLYHRRPWIAKAMLRKTMLEVSSPWLQTVVQSYNNQHSMLLAQKQNTHQWNRMESPDIIHRVQFSSVAQSCPTLCDPMNRNTPGLAVHHQLPKFTQTHVHQVGDAIQPSHPLSAPSLRAPNPSQHQGLFQWVNSSHEVA